MSGHLGRPPHRAAGRRLSMLVKGMLLAGAMSLSLAGAARVHALKPAQQSQPAEARLLEIYRLIGAGQGKLALKKAQKLVEDVPNFQLAQMVYGDLLLSQTAPLKAMGNAPSDLTERAPQRIEQLRTEAERRLVALRERPPANALPSQFIEIPPSTRHAIAVDASRSRLYLFENGPHGLRVVADHYASIGRLGAEKAAQGDQRTPLGVYYITSRLDGKQLTDFYGVGALPLNYPNEYDRRQGRTGSGIWLHGVPSDSYARSPNSTDGCVALANPELKSILESVQPRTTPVVIAKSLTWVPTKTAEHERRNMRNLIEGWRVARASGDLTRLMSFYSSQFSNGTRDFNQWRQWLEKEVISQRGKSLQLKELAILGWRDKSDILVVTFGEVSNGQRTGVVKRQYWGKEGGLWKIFYEGVIG